MKKALYIVIAIAAIAVVGFYSFNQSKKVEIPAELNVPAESAKPEERIYEKGGEIYVYNSPSPETLAHEERIGKGTKLSMQGQENDFYHVSYELQGERKEGYIPVWYLDDSKAIIESYESEFRVLKEDTKGLLYPEGAEIVDLEQGKLLKPFMQSGDWVQVDIIVYDIPAVLKAWVKKDSLVSTDEMQPKEGFLPSDAELYFVEEYKDIKNAKPEKESDPKNIYIERREGGYVYVMAAGGWNAWVEEKWIRYTGKELQ